MRYRFTAIMTLLVCGFSLAAMANNSPWDYRELVIAGGFSSITNAYVVDNIELDSIGYHHASVAAPQLWFKFNATYADKVHIQMGVPVLDGYQSLRPVAAIIGPGLPVPDRPLPFTLPDGFGALVYDTSQESVETFTETFTGTKSWMFKAEDYFMPQVGTYYIVGFIPTGTEGKFWLAVGEKPYFKLADVFTMSRTIKEIQAFFEIPASVGTTFWAQALFAFLVFFLGVIAVSPV